MERAYIVSDLERATRAAREIGLDITVFRQGTAWTLDDGDRMRHFSREADVAATINALIESYRANPVAFA